MRVCLPHTTKPKTCGHNLCHLVLVLPSLLLNYRAFLSIRFWKLLHHCFKLRTFTISIEWLEASSLFKLKPLFLSLHNPPSLNLNHVARLRAAASETTATESVFSGNCAEPVRSFTFRHIA